MAERKYFKIICYRLAWFVSSRKTLRTGESKINHNDSNESVPVIISKSVCFSYLKKPKFWQKLATVYQTFQKKINTEQLDLSPDPDQRSNLCDQFDDQLNNRREERSYF